MTCKQVHLVLDAYVDEELAISEMHGVKAHLSQCEACRMEEREARALKEILSGAPTWEPSEDFEERLVSHVMSTATATSAPRRFEVSFPFLAAVSFATAAATLLVISNLPHTTTPPVLTAKESMRRDIGQDLFFSSASDPLGPRTIVPSSYVRR